MFCEFDSRSEYKVVVAELVNDSCDANVKAKLFQNY